MEQNTGQHNTPALGGCQLLWGQQRCGHGLVRKEFVLQAQGFVQPQSPCVNTRHWACPCDPNLNSGELETGRSSLASGRCGQEAELQSKRESRNPLLFLTSDLSLSPLSFWFWLPHGDWKSHH